ncbi:MULTISPECIES: hypothetical protein [unclassified Mesorhizobium]|uniref:hypothetical protein n=1 Tax=unclassified Mesorhizobium TaxID=325217 RepID=UPI0012EB0A25|nr:MULTISPECIES: hypothetical protein [unclassified Mesorhizobium]
MTPKISPEKTTSPSELMEAQRLTIGDLVVFQRRARRGVVSAQMALANMRQNRDRRAVQIRSSFKLIEGGKPSA